MPSVDIVIPSFNAGKILCQTLESILSQEFEPEWQLSIFLVDDCSTNDSISTLPATVRNAIHISSLAINRGRAGARNHGANVSDGDYVLFLDSDCVMDNETSFRTLADPLGTSCDFAYGRCKSIGNGFWASYFNAVSKKRDNLGLAGDISGFSSQYFILTRELFKRSGGFDEAYKKYGFEDRDLALRITALNARIKYVPNSVVLHEEIKSVSDVAKKFEDAGQYSSILFEKSHAAAYRSMNFGKIDSRLHPIRMKPVLFLLGPFKSFLYEIGDKLIRNNVIPFFMKSAIVKIILGIAYCIGTSKHASD